MKQRNRSTLDLHVLNLEISRESYVFLKALAAAKRTSMADYIDEMVMRKKARLLERGFIQSSDSAC